MSTSVSSLTTNFFPSPQNGFTTTTSGSVSSGATSVGLNSVAGYSNGQVATFVIDPTDANKKQTFTGVIDTSGLQVTSVVWTAGTNQSHALGATVVDYATATHIAQISKGFLIEHGQNGRHTAINATSVTSTGAVSGTTGTFSSDVSDNSTTLKTIRSETTFDFIASGCVWSGDAYGSTRVASCTSGVVYIAGKRLTVAAVTARTFTASKDVYCDLHDNGDGTAVWVYTDNTTNAASPALTAGNLRGAIIVVGASNIASAASVNQGQEDRVLPIASSTPYSVTDSLGNLICPRDPNRRTLGYRQLLTTVGGISTTTTLLTGLTTNVITNGRPIKVTVFIYAVSNTSAAAWFLDLYNALTITGPPIQSAQAYMPTSGTGHSANLVYRFTPSAGTVPICVGGRTNTGTLTAGGTSATTPAFILIEYA